MGAAQYDKLSTAIVQRFIRVLGATDALRYARRVPNLSVEADGTVRAGATKQDLALLVSQYKNVGGSISVYFMKNAIASMLPDSLIDLPEDLR
jgi:hypothetical protein